MTSRNRQVGDIVWDDITTSCGPLRDRALGLKRGRVTGVRTYDRGRTCVEIEWFGNLDPQTGTVLTGPALLPPFRFSTTFDWGVMSTEEIGIILKGGLLDGAGGDFTEPQCAELLALHPLYQRAYDDPSADVIVNPEVSLRPAA